MDCSPLLHRNCMPCWRLEPQFSELPLLLSFKQPPCKSPLRFLHSSASYPQTCPQLLHFPLNAPSPSTEERCISSSWLSTLFPLQASHVIAQPVKTGAIGLRLIQDQACIQCMLIFCTVSIHKLQLVMVTSYLSITPTTSF